MRRKKKLTRFGWQVTRRLEDRGMSRTELAEEVEARTGKFVTANYIRNALCGVPTPWRVLRAIQEILDLREGGQHEQRERMLPGES